MKESKLLRNRSLMKKIRFNMKSIFEAPEEFRLGFARQVKYANWVAHIQREMNRKNGMPVGPWKKITPAEAWRALEKKYGDK